MSTKRDHYHVIDQLRFLVGDVSRVSARTRTLISDRRRSEDSDEHGQVDVDDWAVVNLDFACGASGVVEASRVASGADGTSVEIFGSLGSVRLQGGDDGWPAVHVFKDQTHYRGLRVEVDSVKRELLSLYPGSKMSVGSMVNGHMVTLLRYGLSIVRREATFPGAPDFEAAKRAQEILEASYISASQDGRAVDLPIPV